MQSRKAVGHTAPRRLRQEAAEEVGMVNCNPRDTPTEANFMKQVRARILSNPNRELLGMESEYQEQWGEFAWLLKTREDLCFFVGMGVRFLRCAGPVEMGWVG